MSPSLPPGRAAAMPGGEGRLGRRDQLRVAVGGRPDAEGDGGVAHPAVQGGAGVHAEQVAVAQPVVAGDAVQRGVVDRRADHRRVRHRGELRVVVEERRGRPGLGEDLPGGRVELPEGDARRGDGTGRRQYVGDDLPGGPDRVDLPRRLDLDHPPSSVAASWLRIRTRARHCGQAYRPPGADRCPADDLQICRDWHADPGPPRARARWAEHGSRSGCGFGLGFRRRPR